MGKLVLFLVDGSTLDIPLEGGRVSIGRRSSNDVCLPYPAVSGEHAIVIPVAAGAVIEDLGSTNGTFVNGKRMPRQLLRDGDRVDIGRQKFVYLAEINAVAKLPPNPRGFDVDHKDEASAVQDAGVASGAEGEDAPATPAIDALEPLAEAGPTLRVTTGPSAGRTLSLTKDETIVGRVGLQVAAVRKVAEGYRLLAIEGADPPKVNGVPVPAEGVVLASGDAIDLASVQLEYSVVAHSTTA